MITSTIRLATARRCRMKRPSTMRHWLRRSTPNSSRSVGPSGAPGSGMPTGAGAMSATADPRVEIPVDDVGDPVEDNDQDRGDEQPRLHDVDVLHLQRVEEEAPHPRPPEHRLGDDGA